MFYNGIILVNLSMLTHDYLRNGAINVPAAMVAGFQGLYFLTFLFNEVRLHLGKFHVDSTFSEGHAYNYGFLNELQQKYRYLLLILQEDMFVSNRDTNDGCGYLFTLWSVISPFFYTFPVRFLVQHPQTWNYYYLAGFGFLNRKS